MNIVYTASRSLEVAEFIDLLKRSTLAERRPIDDLPCVTAMLENSDLLVTAWHDETLVGAARSVTDYNYCCYLSDLAVDRALQRRGIGRELIEQTRRALRPGCRIILLAAPAAASYYARVGFELHPSAWTRV